MLHYLYIHNATTTVATADPDALMASPFVQSSIIKHTLNPEWPAEEKMKIPLLSNDVDGMSRNGHLFLSVWDYDMTNEDDLIGLCRIPLQVSLSYRGLYLFIVVISVSVEWCIGNPLSSYLLLSHPTVCTQPRTDIYPLLIYKHKYLPTGHLLRCGAGQALHIRRRGVRERRGHGPSHG